MPTIRDVAREAGVSVATVSYVLNNKSHFYSDATRDRVLEAIKTIGYTRNINARNLKANETRLIGYAWHHAKEDETNPILDRFIYSLAQYAEQANYHILTFTHPIHDPLPVYDDLIRTQRVDGFVLSGTQRHDVRIHHLREEKFPFVTFGRSNLDGDYTWVDTDGFDGAFEATKYLISLGHRRIGFVGWPEESISGSFRLDGYREALAQAQLEARPEYLFRGEQSEETGRLAWDYWSGLPAEQRPTATVAVTDLIAIGLMKAIENANLQVGHDFSVIGFDNSPMSQHLRPSLTTIQQPIDQIAYQLIQLLEARLVTGVEENKQILVKPQLVIRNSCGAPSSP